MEVCVLSPLDLDKFEHLYPDSITTELPADAILIGCIEESPLEAAGILMAHVEDSEILLDWIYVDEPHRRKGGGRAMLELLRDAAQEEGSSIAITAIFSQEDENVSPFLKACNFMVTFREGDKGFSSLLKDFPKLKVVGDVPETFSILGDVPEAEINRFSQKLGKRGVEGLAITLPFVASDYMDESGALLNEDGKIKGLCLMQKIPTGIRFTQIYNKTSTPGGLAFLINQCTDLLKEHYPPDTPFYFASVNSKIDEAIERFIPIQYSSEIYFGTYRFDL